MPTSLTRSSLAVACLAMMCSTVFAEGPDGKRRGGKRPGNPLVAALDTNKDGRIDSQEISNAATALLALDKDGDGQLTPEEMRPSRGGGSPGERLAGSQGRQGGQSEEKMKQFFDRNDANGDGKLSGDEIPERMSGRIDQVDTNSDGAISFDEMKAAMAKRGGRGKGDKAKRGKGKKRGGDAAGTPGGDRPTRPAVEA